jgi:hypothetical protein
MAWHKKEEEASWREYLTKEEAARLAVIERHAQELNEKRRLLTDERYRMVNRAYQRMRYALGKS